MKKEEWLRAEIAKWRSDGVIDTTTADTLLARYKMTESRFGLGAILAGAFGALLMGLGVIAIFAANWDCFGRAERAVIAVAPVVACGMAALVAKAKGLRTMALWEPLGILWFISVVAASCLVAQTYQVGGSVPGLVLFVTALTLPVVWTTRSVGAMSAWLVLPIVWMFSKMEWHDRSDIAATVKAMLLMAASLPAYIAFLRRKPQRAALVLGQLATGLAYSFGTGMIILRGVYPHSETWWILIFWICSAVVFAAAAAFKLPVWPKVAMSVSLIATMPSPGLSLPIYAASLALAMGVAAWGIAKARLADMNFGVVMLLWLILAKFFASRADFTVKGLVLISAGIMLAVLNVVLVRMKKRRAE